MDAKTELKQLRAQNSSLMDSLATDCHVTKRALETLEAGVVELARSFPATGGLGSAQDETIFSAITLTHFQRESGGLVQTVTPLLKRLEEVLSGQFGDQFAPHRVLDRSTITPAQRLLYRVFTEAQAFIGYLGDLTPARVTKALRGDGNDLTLLSAQRRTYEGLWFAIDELIGAGWSLDSSSLPSGHR